MTIGRFWVGCLALAALVSVGAAEAAAQRSGPTPAMKTPEPPKAWASVGRLCRDGARRPVSDTALRIAQTARNEFFYFGGHRIDSNGRLFSFGVVETEQEESDEAITTYRLGHLGWWQVLRYWRLLGEDKLPVDAAREALRLRGFAGASRSPDDKDIDKPVRLSLDRALDAIEAVNARVGLTEIEKEILRQAVIRAAISDVAWSAAFIGAVMRQAGVTGEQFAYSDAHMEYIRAAFASSLGEADGKAQASLYRACPAAAVPPRAGDLLCYHRHAKEFGHRTASQVRAMVLADLERGTAAPAIRRSHCDVVAHVDRRAGRVYVVGGNVQQSVTIKKLRLNPKTGGLLEVQPDNCALDGKWTFPGPDAGKPVAPHLSGECTLNRKTWFVLLQAR